MILHTLAAVKCLWDFFVFSLFSFDVLLIQIVYSKAFLKCSFGWTVPEKVRCILYLFAVSKNSLREIKTNSLKDLLMFQIKVKSCRNQCYD